MEMEWGTAPDGQKPKNVKTYNINLILWMFRIYGTVSKAQMAGMTSLSKTTISKVFVYLEEKGIIMPIGQGDSTKEGGKKPLLYVLKADHCYALLLSLGFAEHISCTVTDFTGRKVAYKRVATPAEVSYEEALRLSVPLIMETMGEAGITHEQLCGLAIIFDGVVDTIGGIILGSANHNWAGDLRICQDLSALLPFRTNIIIDNACCFAAYAELANRDMLVGNKMVITWAPDRTLGCSLLSEQRLVANNEGITGGFGHVIIDTASTMRCRCGRYGCLQSVLSREALLEFMSRTCQEYPDSPATEKYLREEIEVQDIFILAKQEDPYALELMRHMVHYFSMLIYNVFCLNSAQKIVLQGIFSLSGDLFLKQLMDQLLNFNQLHIFKSIDIVYSQYGNEEDFNPYPKGATMYLVDTFLLPELL